MGARARGRQKLLVVLLISSVQYVVAAVRFLIPIVSRLLEPGLTYARHVDEQGVNRHYQVAPETVIIQTSVAIAKMPQTKRGQIEYGTSCHLTGWSVPAQAAGSVSYYAMENPNVG